MNIRRAHAKDMKRINELFFEVGKIHSDGRPDIFKSGAKKYSDEELISIIENDMTPIYVAENGDGYVLGYCFCIYKETKDNILLQDSKTLYIDDLCIEEGHRGEHIGTSLYEYVKEVAKKNRCNSITLNVWSFNEKAAKFYEKLGLTPQKTIMEKKI